MARVIYFVLLLIPSIAMAQTSHGHSGGPAMATEAGQSAFAAIQEVVAILEADPATDWNKVDIEALRQHLIDMNNVTLAASVRTEPTDDGARFIVTGAGDVRDSIRRMVGAHVATMNNVGGWQLQAADIADGITLAVHVPPRDLAKLRAIGFIGLMTRGMHHQHHHVSLARGVDPHRHR